MQALPTVHAGIAGRGGHRPWIARTTLMGVSPDEDGEMI